MEGALPSIVGGMVACPVIGLPSSVGYGASFGGIAALLSMLNSCASNVAVVNIDAGFKAGYLAGLIATRRHDQNATRLPSGLQRHDISSMGEGTSCCLALPSGFITTTSKLPSIVYSPPRHPL